MKFPSVQYLASQASAALRRFYLPLLFAFLGSAAAVYMIDRDKEQVPVCIRLLFTCILGLSCATGCTLFAERSQKSAAKWLIPLLAVAFSIFYGFFLAPDSFYEVLGSNILFWVLAIVAHLWVAVAAYLHKNDPVGFWRFNEALYSRMLLSVLFSVALFAGIALAIAACNILLKFHIHDKVYPELWVVITGIFNTWFFLAGVPRDFEALKVETKFPKQLKIFTQYILIPIVALYAIILYVYTAKIIIEWSLPKGWVSTLIICFSALGVLAVLLVYPLRNDKDNAWVRLFSRFFFIASLPLIILLYIAISQRVIQYGITEYRYYVLLLGAWIGFISCYFIFSARKNIRLIPLSLAATGILSVVGPWNVFKVSEASQLHRLERLLIRTHIWKPGEKVTGPHVILSVDDGNDVKSMLSYFVERKKATLLQAVFATDLDKLVRDIYKKSKSDNAYWSEWEERGALNKTLDSILHVNQQEVYFTDIFFRSNFKSGMDVAGFSRINDFFINLSEASTKNISQGRDSLNFLTIALQQDSIHCTLEISRDGKILDELQLTGKIKMLKDQQPEDVRDSLMTINGAGALHSRLLIKSILLRDPRNIGDAAPVRQVSGWLLTR